MRSAIALVAVFCSVASGCSETTPTDSGSTTTGGTHVTSGNTTSAAKGGSTNSAAHSGGSTARTSAQTSGGSTDRTSAASGGKSATSSKAAGGSSASEGGADGDGGTTSTVSGKPTGGKSGGAGSGSKGGSSGVGGSNTGGKASGGANTGTATSSTGGQPAGGNTGTGPGKSAGCGKAPTIASNQYNNGQPIAITVDGKQRRYILSVPTNYDNSHPYRLMVVYHQLDGNDKQMYSQKYYGLQPLSDNSTIFVAPNGQKNGSPCSGTGDGDSGCGWPNSSDSDLALADAVVAQMEENFCIDTTRIFATGWSYGGSMSYRTACSRPLGGTGASWGVRGIAIYAAAQLSGNCTPSKPVAFYHAHGTHDSVLNYDSMGLPLAQNFAKANGCTWATPTKVSSGAHVCTNMTGCTEGYPLEFCSFNGDHTPWPDNGQPQGSWGPAEAWKFLSQF